MPGQEELEVLAGRAGDRAAEQVGEHQQEQHRRDRHVEQLLGDVLDLQHPAPAEGQARRQRARRAAARAAARARASAVGRRPASALARSSAGAQCRAPRSPSSVLGRVAGQRQEDLVEARLAEREVGDARCPARESAATRLGARARRRRPRPTAPRGRARAWTRRRARARARRSASARWSGSSSRTCSVPWPTEAFSSPGVPSAITRPWSMTAIRSASWSASSRYCVQSRTVVPVRDERADDVPDLVAASAGRARSSARRGTSAPGVTTMLAAMSSRRRMPPE